MTVESDSLNLHTHYEGEILDITEKIQAIVAKGNIRNGVAFLFVPGSTAALTTLEYEPGLLVDLPSMLGTIAPTAGTYEHESQWHDGNDHYHVRAALLEPYVFGRTRDLTTNLKQYFL